MKRLIFLSLFAFLPLFSSAQWSMTFCNAADDQGNLSGFYTTFYVPPGGAYIYVVLNVADGKTFNTHHIQFDIYKGADFSTSLKYTIDPGWGRFWTKVTFYDPGEYRIDTYDMDEYNEFMDAYGGWMTTGYVSIKPK